MATKGTPRVICIEITPYGGETNLPVGFVRAKLTDKTAWFVTTPVVAFVNKKLVVDINVLPGKDMYD